jgi:hypothetical protein
MREEFLGDWNLVQNGNEVEFEEISENFAIKMYCRLRGGVLERDMKAFWLQLDAWKVGSKYLMRREI